MTDNLFDKTKEYFDRIPSTPRWDSFKETMLNVLEVLGGGFVSISDRRKLVNECINANQTLLRTLRKNVNNLNKLKIAATKELEIIKNENDLPPELVASLVRARSLSQHTPSGSCHSMSCVV